MRKKVGVRIGPHGRMREEGQAIPADRRAGQEWLGPRGAWRKQRRADLLARHLLAGVWEEETDADCRKLK